MSLRKDTTHIEAVTGASGWAVKSASLQGQLLIASPHIQDSRFHHSVIMMCQHDQSSAMGVIINCKSDGIDLAKLFDTMDLDAPRFCGNQTVHIGGPVDNSRGFVLHSQDHMRPESVEVTHEIGLTCSVKILKDITDGIGPQHSIVSLGYAGWQGGQLEAEIAQNSWLNLPATSQLLFHTDCNDVWHHAYATLGIDPANYVDQPGNA